MIEIFAPAKINLTLHVTGHRDDGYHLLDSLVCFPNIGDRLTFTPADEMSLTIQGAPDLPCDDSNLVMKAARLYMSDQPQAIVLHKALPIASGIGGGSADAAAVLRAADQLQAQRPPNETALMLGADVSVCIPSAPSRMRGIGDHLNLLKDWPDSGYILLVNPHIEVSTPAIFKALTQKTNAPMPSDLPDLTNLDTMINFIASQRNDLQAPAIAQQPVIAEVIDTISSTPDCLFARMSGSGATCFGIYRTQEQVLKAAAQIASNFGDWWVEYGALQH